MSQAIRAIAYVSHASFDYQQQYQQLAEAIEEIRAGSAHRNKNHGIGGVLYYYKGAFFQYLEGPSKNIDRLVDAIRNDPRHANFKIMFDLPLAAQRTPDWGLKYVSLDAKIKEFLGSEPMNGDLYNLSEAQAAELVEVFVENRPQSLATDPMIQIVDPDESHNQMASSRMKLALLRPNLMAILILLALTAGILVLLFL